MDPRSKPGADLVLAQTSLKSSKSFATIVKSIDNFDETRHAENPSDDPA
jgi:hypothetical protein